MRDTILVSGYFTGAGEARKLRYLERLDTALHNYGLELCLLNLQAAPVETVCRFIHLPHFIEKAPLLARNSATADDWPEWLAEAVAADAEHLGIGNALRLQQLLYFRAHLRRVLRDIQPKICLLWHQFNGMHHALAHLLREARLPFSYAEYGLLPGTIAFDEHGQMAESWPAQHSREFDALPIDAATTEAVERYLDLVRDQRRTRRDQTRDENIVSLIREKRRAGAPVLFFAGQNDFRTGILPAGFPRSRIHSPHFDDTAGALEAVAEVGAKNGWHVVFKPHPLASHPLTRPDAPNDSVTVAPAADIFDCITECDATVTVVSQAAYLALIHDRPVVLLGRLPLSGKQCVYELPARDQLESVLREAIRLGLTPSQRLAWRKHAAQLCEHYLFTMDEDIESIIGRGPGEAAQYLIDTISKVPAINWEELPLPLQSAWGTDAELNLPALTRSVYPALAATAPLQRILVRALPSSFKRRWTKRSVTP